MPVPAKTIFRHWVRGSWSHGSGKAREGPRRGLQNVLSSEGDGMIALRFNRYALGACVAAIIFAGCSSSGSTSGPPNCNFQSNPFVQLLYPIPGSKNVDPKGHILILAGNEHQLPWLTANGNFSSYGKLIPPPNPLPQPELTPAPGASLYAASVKTLHPGTKYGVSVTLDFVFCDGSMGDPKKLGWFATQSN